MEPVELRPGAVLLSFPTTADVPAIVSACQDPAIAEYTSVPFPYREEHARAFVTEIVPRSWEASARRGLSASTELSQG